MAEMTASEFLVWSQTKWKTAERDVYGDILQESCNSCELQDVCDSYTVEGCRVLFEAAKTLGGKDA